MSFPFPTTASIANLYINFLSQGTPKKINEVFYLENIPFRVYYLICSTYNTLFINFNNKNPYLKAFYTLICINQKGVLTIE